MGLNDLLLKREEVVLNINPKYLNNTQGFILPFPEILYEKMNDSTKKISYECARSAFAKTALTSMKTAIKYEINEIKTIDDAIISFYEESDKINLNHFYVSVFEKLQIQKSMIHQTSFIVGRINHFLFDIDEEKKPLDKFMYGEDKIKQKKIDDFKTELSESKEFLISKINSPTNFVNIIESRNGIYTLNLGIDESIIFSNNTGFNRRDINLSKEKFDKLFPSEKVMGFIPDNLYSTYLSIFAKEWSINYINNLIQSVQIN